GTIRRRRECLGCRRRFTTYERSDEVSVVVVKRSGEREPLDRMKIVVGLPAAAKSRPLSDSQLEAIAADIGHQLRLGGAGAGGVRPWATRAESPPATSGARVRHSSSTRPCSMSWPLSDGPPSHTTTPENDDTAARRSTCSSPKTTTSATRSSAARLPASALA